MAVQFGYCGLDRRRLPLLGDEIRACWEPAEAATEAELPAEVAAAAIVRTFDFVPLGEARPVVAGVAVAAVTTLEAPPATLWGDATDR